MNLSCPLVSGCRIAQKPLPHYVGRQAKRKSQQINASPIRSLLFWGKSDHVGRVFIFIISLVKVLILMLYKGGGQLWFKDGGGGRSFVNAPLLL